METMRRDWRRLNMIIRHLNRQSAKLLIPSLIQLSKDASYPNVGVDELSHLFVAYDGDLPVAFSGLACYHGHWCFRICVVHPSYQGRGIQRQLIRARFRFLRAKDAHHVNVWAAPSNTYSLNNLVSEGFRFVREKPRAFNGVSHIKLRKIL